jgi:hypothetical protein
MFSNKNESIPMDICDSPEEVLIKCNFCNRNINIETFFKCLDCHNFICCYNCEKYLNYYHQNNHIFVRVHDKILLNHNVFVKKK